VNVWTWWIGYTLLAIWAQEWFGGIDFFTPGLIVFLQTDRWKGCIWSAIIWGIMQEGTGALSFGSILLFDAGLAAMFMAGKWLLETGNLIFVMVLSAVLVIWREMVVMWLASLQDLVVFWTTFPLMALQFFAYVLTWALIYPLFSKAVSRVRD
jgi:hypothetical protein